MALSPVERLKILGMAKDLLFVRRRECRSDVELLVRQLGPKDSEPAAEAQVRTLYAPLLTELTAALARVMTAINNTAPTNAEKVAYVNAIETTIKTAPGDDLQP